jgi:hypothetical protein
MDAATAAAMSDPDCNRWFRRRWREMPTLQMRQPVPTTEAADALELTGHELREQWRRERAVGLDPTADAWVSANAARQPSGCR